MSRFDFIHKEKIYTYSKIPKESVYLWKIVLQYSP